MIEYDRKRISKITYINVIGISLDNTLYWTTHLVQFIPKLSSACYAIRVSKQITSQETLLMVYYSFFTQL
jgi:hypothetical protein